MTDKGVSIIIPAYNEEGSIAAVVGEIRASLTGIPFEIIVVDDGSTDKTAEILKNMEGVSIISHGKNKGYGASLKTGIKHSQYERVLIMDADGSYPVGKIPELLGRLDGCDMAVGSRKHNFTIRTPARWFIRRLAAVLTGRDIPDLNSGMRAMKKSSISRFMHLLPDKFSFTSTITIALLTNGYEVEYIPIDYNRRIGESKIRPIADLMNFIQLIIRMVLYFNPLAIFLPLSLFLVMSGVGVLLYSYLFTPKVMDITTIVLILAGVQVFSVGLLADLVNKFLNK